MNVFDHLSPLIPRLSASSKQAKDRSHPLLPLSAPLTRKGIDSPSLPLQGLTQRNQKESGNDSSTCFEPVCSPACRYDGEMTRQHPAKPSFIRPPKTNALEFSNRDQFLQRYHLSGKSEKMHSENKAVENIAHLKSVVSIEACRAPAREDLSVQNTKLTLSDTSVNTGHVEKKSFVFKPHVKVDQDNGCQSRDKAGTMQAPWLMYKENISKTCLVHPVQTSCAPITGTSTANVNEECYFLKGTRCHEDTVRFRQHPSNLDKELLGLSKRTRFAEEPYYVSIHYPDSVYEDMSDIVPPEVRPKPAVPAKPPNVGAPSPSSHFTPQGQSLGGPGGVGVSALPPSAIPVPIGSHGAGHAGSHGIGLALGHGGSHGAPHVSGHGHSISNSTSGGSTLLGYIGIDTIIEQMRKKTMKTGFDFNIMVVGHSGQGKSTLVNTLFKSQVSRRSAGWSRDDKIPKTVEIKSVSHVIEEGGVKMKLTVVDTPGFGDLINNNNCWEPISKYINEQYEKFLKEEVNITRKKRIPDTRVHCCLYFISPTGHSLRQLDIEFMKRLSHSVNIIPVIAKADTMTPEERQEFKQRVKKELEMNGIEFYPQKEFDEDMEDKSDNDKIREAMPFAVVGSDKEYQVNGRRVLGRKTAWGVVEVENPNHCEFAQLRDFLIRSHLQDLKEVTHNIHYETFRAKRLHENGGLHPVDGPESNL